MDFLPMRVNLMLHLATLEELEAFIKLGYKTGDGSPFFRIGPFKNHYRRLPGRQNSSAERTLQ